MSDPFRITWSGQRSVSQLEIEYTCETDSDEHYFVIDELYMGGTDGALRPTNQLIVLPSDEPNTVDLIGGFILLPNHKGPSFPAGGRQVSRLGPLTGKKIIPMPLKAWHPWARAAVPPVDEKTTQFRLVFGYVPSPGSWTPSPMIDGSVKRTLQIPYTMTKEKFVKGPVKTL